MQPVDLTKRETEQLKSAFDLFDDSKTGQVPANLIKDSLLDISKNFDQTNVYRIILELETLGDKPINFTEFCNLFAAGTAALLKGGQVTRKEAQRLFRLIDTEDKGKISYRDLKRLSDELNEPITPAELEEMIHRADHDGDGLVDVEEFWRIISIRNSGGK